MSKPDFNLDTIITRIQTDISNKINNSEIYNYNTTGTLFSNSPYNSSNLHNTFNTSNLSNTLHNTNRVPLYKNSNSSNMGIVKAGSTKLSPNYHPVDKSEWLSIPDNTYIRYFDNMDIWQAGGKIARKGEDIFYLYKFDRTKRCRITWNVKFEDISRLYKWVDTPEEAERKKKLNEKKRAMYDEPNENFTGGNDLISSSTTNPLNNTNNTLNSTVYSTVDNTVEHMNNIGDKILFGDSIENTTRIETLEKKIEEINEKIQKITLMIKKLMTVIYKADE